MAKILVAEKFDGFLILKPENIFWTSGFRGSFAAFLLQKNGENFLITDSRYFLAAQKLAAKKKFRAILFDENFEKFAEKFRGKNFAIEDSARISEQKFWKKKFRGVKFLIKKNFFEKLRAQKNRDEIEKIKIAAAHVDAVLQPFLREKIRAGISEKFLAFELEIALRARGKFEIAFPPIVAFGANSAVPHHRPSEKILQKNENILIDCGAKFFGFCSDLTRNFFFGTAPREFLHKFENLKNAQNLTIKKFVAGEKISAIEKFCRKKIGPDEKFFGHSLGHGVGLEIHEQPAISQKSREKLRKNQIVTCEPGVYFPEKFGIRIEDLLQIRENLPPKILSKSEKNLIFL